MNRWLMVGLGNPGASYARHRHNIGFRIVDAFAKRHQIVFRAVMRGQAERGEGVVGGAKVLLLKPLTFMNLSGEPTRAAMDADGLSPDELVVVHDDLDIDLGRMKWVQGRGAGGHNGVQSLAEVLGTVDFCRLRAGVGRPSPEVDPADYVLSAFSRQDEVVVEDFIEQAVLAIEMFLQYGLAAVQQKYHS